MKKFYIVLCCSVIASFILAARSIEVAASPEDVLFPASWWFTYPPETLAGRPVAAAPYHHGTLDIISRQKQVPCSTTPIGGITISDGSAICIGSTFTLSVINATSGFTGLSYQWQYSTDSINWVNISGETSNVFSKLIEVVNSTYYRREIGCGSLKSYSSGALVSITPPFYASLPFNEGFETVWQNLCSSTRGLPSNNWRNQPLTGANSWRREDDGSSAGWTSPDHVSWPLGANGTSHSAVFHSSRAPLNVPGDLSVYLDCSTGLSSKELRFYYIPGDSLAILLSTNGGSSFTTLEQIGKASIDFWHTRTIGFTSSAAIR